MHAPGGLTNPISTKWQLMLPAGAVTGKTLDEERAFAAGQAVQQALHKVEKTQRSLRAIDMRLYSTRTSYISNRAGVIIHSAVCWGY
jgi:hypothetical protein